MIYRNGLVLLGHGGISILVYLYTWMSLTQTIGFLMTHDYIWLIKGLATAEHVNQFQLLRIHNEGLTKGHFPK
jgi:hypothetical protein